MYEVTAKSTQFGYNTPHGPKTPHKYPIEEEVDRSRILMGLVRELYPSGRAFNMPEKGVFENLHKALNVSFMRLVNDARLTIDSTIPDNGNFSAEDAELWEYRLGLFINPPISLEARKQAIKRKMSYPSNMKARQHPLFLQHQLQIAGFNVYIHENRFYESGELIYKRPDEIIDLGFEPTQHGGDSQHGLGTQHGSAGFEVIANKIGTESYGVGENNLWATFFIGGEQLGQMAAVPENRKNEFRELVLKLKPAHTVAFLFINYN